MLQPRLIDSYINPDGTEEKVPAKAPQQVVSKETAKQVRDILESAVTEGEIKEAAIDGYRVGAKTGTSESPVRRRQIRLLRLHRLDGGNGAHGRSAVYC